MKVLFCLISTVRCSISHPTLRPSNPIQSTNPPTYSTILLPSFEMVTENSDLELRGGSNLESKSGKCTLLPFCTWLHYWTPCIVDLGPFLPTHFGGPQCEAFFLEKLKRIPPKNIWIWTLFLKTLCGPFLDNIYSFQGVLGPVVHLLHNTLWDLILKICGESPTRKDWGGLKLLKCSRVSPKTKALFLFLTQFAALFPWETHLD